MSFHIYIIKFIIFFTKIFIFHLQNSNNNKIEYLAKVYITHYDHFYQSHNHSYFYSKFINYNSSKFYIFYKQKRYSIDNYLKKL